MDVKSKRKRKYSRLLAKNKTETGSSGVGVLSFDKSPVLKHFLRSLSQLLLFQVVISSRK